MAGALPAGAVQALARRAGALCPAGAASQPGVVPMAWGWAPRGCVGVLRCGAVGAVMDGDTWQVTEVACPPAEVTHRAAKVSCALLQRCRAPCCKGVVHTCASAHTEIRASLLRDVVHTCSNTHTSLSAEAVHGAHTCAHTQMHTKLLSALRPSCASPFLHAPGLGWGSCSPPSLPGQVLSPGLLPACRSLAAL